MIVTSKMNHVYISQTGVFIYPGVNTFDSVTAEKLEKSKDFLDHVNANVIEVKKVNLDEKVVKIESNDTSAMKSAKAILAMDATEAISAIKGMINIEVLVQVTKLDKRTPVVSAAEKVIKEITSQKKDEENF